MKEVRKIIKNGAGTYYVSIPKDMIKKLRLKERQKVTVRTSGKKIVIEDWQK
jgi:antitoxin component of MazEF toxin-antitoxin module